MAGLLEKDIRLLMGNKTDTGNFVCNCSCSRIFRQRNFIIGYLPFVVEMIAISTIAYDEMDHGYQFL